MRVVLDTNVLVSGLVGRGPPATIVDLVLSGVVAIAFSRETFEEFRGVLLGSPKFRAIPDALRSAYVAALADAARFVIPEHTVTVLRDEADNRFLEAATAFEADCLVTGDERLLELTSFRGVRIVSPRVFLEVLEASDSRI